MVDNDFDGFFWITIVDWDGFRLVEADDWLRFECVAFFESVVIRFGTVAEIKIFYNKYSDEKNKIGSEQIICILLFDDVHYFGLGLHIYNVIDSYAHNI